MQCKFNLSLSLPLSLSLSLPLSLSTYIYIYHNPGYKSLSKQLHLNLIILFKQTHLIWGHTGYQVEISVFSVDDDHTFMVENCALKQ